MAERVIGIVPAAGYGTRLGGLPYPKELLPITVSGKQLLTVLESNLVQLAEAGVSEAVIVIRPHKAIIREYLGDRRFGLTLHYVEQKEQLSKEGLPDAVASAFYRADLYFMLMGDVYFTASGMVRELRQAMEQRRNALAGVLTWPTDEPHRFGIVQQQDGRITSVVDKPVAAEAPALMWGAVAFRPGFWPFVKGERETFSKALHRAAQDFPVISVPASGKYLDLGTPTSFAQGFTLVNSAS